MAGFLHPNLALIFGLETWRGIPVLVVEHLAGGTLTARLGRHLGVQAVLKLGVALAAALEAMHGQEFLHRDVKPSNIGFAADQTPKLLDFGLSRLVEEARIEPREAAGEGLGETNAGLRITLTGQVAGTPLYLSPEALRGAPPAPAQDLWSLHLVLWEALAGRHPCAGLSLEASLERLAHDKVPELREVRPDCPEPVARLLADGLDPVQHRRPQTAAEVRESFAAVLRQVGSQRSESTGGSFNG
jgi:serine/threonine protein kinase